MRGSRIGLCGAMVVGFALGSCKRPAETPQAITLATTTSARDTGLLDVLTAKFKQQTGIEVKVVAVGSGQAIELGRRGDADIVLAHSPAAEQALVKEGVGKEREEVMWNDFLLVGPPADPARVKGVAQAAEAFKLIAAAGARFVSRGDDSGTHVKERAVWARAGLEPRGDWYWRAGAGMAAALRIATEKRAYTLADRGTYLVLKKTLDLAVLLKGDPLLENRYSVMLVSAARHPRVNEAAARRFKVFLLGAEVQDLIARFRVAELGEPLFFPRKR